MSHHNRGHHNRAHNNQGNRAQHNRAPGPPHQKDISVAQALASIEKFQSGFGNDQMQHDRIRESPNYKQEESLLRKGSAT